MVTFVVAAVGVIALAAAHWTDTGRDRRRPSANSTGQGGAAP